jgi:aminomethyltransferase
MGTSMTDENLRRTPLYALHLELGGKMVPFAGYEMPVQYPAGVLKEHLHTRQNAGLFDVSHMGQGFLAGNTAALERVTPADVAGLKEGMQRYGLLLGDQGTILDDFMFSRLAGEPDLYLVVNAGTKEADFDYIGEKLKGVATIAPRFDRALLALQGPAAAAALERHSPGISDLTFMQVKRTTVALYRRRRLRNLHRGRRCRKGRPRPAGRTGSAAHRPGCSRQSATGSRPLPVRPRH